MKVKKNQEYHDFLYHWFEDNIWEGLPSKNINTTTPLLTLAEFNDDCKNPEFEKLCLKWADWLMNCLPRTKEGGFQHVTSANGDRQGVRLNENEMWIDESIHQVLMHIKYICDKNTGLFYHGWTFNERNNFGGVFWCRGNSWFTLGILDYIDMFNGTMNAGLKTFIVDTYKAQVEKLKELQDKKTGLWHTVLTDPDSYVETSGTAAITAGILKGIRYGILDDSYLPCAKAAIEGILNQIDEDGTVLQVSGGTGMGYNAYQRFQSGSERAISAGGAGSGSPAI